MWSAGDRWSPAEIAELLPASVGQETNPMIVDMGYDPIWFGVLLVVVLEMSLISPPLGLNVFVVKGISDGVPMNEIFMGIIPFWGAMIVCAALLIAFPDLALFLPETMIRN